MESAHTLAGALDEFFWASLIFADGFESGWHTLWHAATGQE